ncbi:MAG TPA: hypothetical protein VND94_06595 [Terriglobia bacterium]|nr:hypothetical protein [Terriglobia bacterium]
MSGFSVSRVIRARGFKHLSTMIGLALALAACAIGKGPSSSATSSMATPGVMEPQLKAGSSALAEATGTISTSATPVGGESPPPTPVTTQSLRLVLRSAAEVNAAKQGSGIVAQPLAADLWQALTIDSGTADSTGSSRFATAADLDRLKLSQADAFTLGLQNATADLPSLTTVTHDLTPHQIGVIQSKGEETSRLLLAKDWAPLARALDGRLLVAVPASDTLLYCVENGTQSVRTFAAAARDTAAKAGHAVSPALLRWTPSGWQSVLVP